jgi:hypothetical protein
MSIDFVIPPEFAANMAKELSDDHRIMAAAAENSLRSKRGGADEILNTPMIALRQQDKKSSAGGPVL